MLLLSHWIAMNISTYLLNFKAWNPKLVTLIGGAVALLGTYISSFSKTEGNFVFWYADVSGAGWGMLYFVPLICGWEYFQDRKGLVTGIVQCAFGFGAFGFGIWAVDIINPNKISPSINYDEWALYPEDIVKNVPKMLRTMTYVWSLLIAASILMITRRPKEVVNLSASERIKQKKAKPKIEFPDLKHWYYCFYSKPFWQLFGMMTLSSYFRTLFSYTFKSFGSTSTFGSPVSEALMTWAISIGGGFVNGASRLTFGILVDRWSFKTIFAIVLII